MKSALNLLPTRVVFMMLAVSLCTSSVASQADPLVAGFVDPPNAAKPRVWWHWMNGNVTKAGVRLDLEWMHRIGLGGFQNFDAALNTPQLVEHPLIYMTPEWWDAFEYAMSLADKLGLEAAIAGSPGWSESGGPWVQPQEAMKKFVWTELSVQGGGRFKGVLPAPSKVTGPFQNVPFFDASAALASRKVKVLPELYVDTRVFAYPLPTEDGPATVQSAQVSSSSGQVAAAVSSDGDRVQAIELPIAAPGEKSWLQFVYPRSSTVASITLAIRPPQIPFAELAGRLPPPAELEASDDGERFRLITVIPSGESAQHTVSFTPVRAKVFRVSWKTPLNPSVPRFDFSGLGFTLPPPSATYPITELRLDHQVRINHFEEKAGFGVMPETHPAPTPIVDERHAISTGSVVDLTDKMRPDGTLDWAVPNGRWTIVRMGYSLTGVPNHPASESGTGLEVDKLSSEHVKTYMDHYLALYEAALGPLMGEHGLRCLVNDSWEAGTQNWTENLTDEFARRRGYSMQPWLPALTGRIVGSSEQSERFLWDFRNTLAELVAANHYDQISAILHSKHMCHYAESHESRRAFIGDGMDAKSTADVPMGAMWTQAPGVNLDMPGYNADVRESASVAHIYGQNIAAAESFTSGVAPWGWAPETLKPTADKELAMGLNRFVIHTSVHQPFIDKGPGLGLGFVGQWFTRNDTWAEQAKPWITYLSRSSFLLQQGRFVADIAYFYGEDSNITALFAMRGASIPAGYQFDFFSAGALTRQLSVDQGQLRTPSGMRYRVLVLDATARQMSFPVLLKIQELVTAGATVVGAKPAEMAGLAGDAAQFKKITDELWGNTPDPKITGAGVVYPDSSVATVLQALKVAPDFEDLATRRDEPELLFVHRTLSDADIYFVNNRTDQPKTFVGAFRVVGREAELWRADTGAMEPASFSVQDGRTQVPLELEPWGATFVVFRKQTSALSRNVAPQITASITAVDGPWKVDFQPDRGAPPSATFNKLISWSQSPDAGIKYFSGTATYRKKIQRPISSLSSDCRLWLDLGDVKNIAEVIVNGRPAGIVWHHPFQLDVTDYLRAGSNTVDVRITNLWVNRLIGDEQPDAPRRYTFTSPVLYKANSPLVPSGLLGPVEWLCRRSK